MKQQFYFYGGALLVLPLLPLLFLLGKRVRRRVPQLPEAQQNVVGDIAGALPPLRLLAPELLSSAAQPPTPPPSPTPLNARNPMRRGD